MLEEVLLTYFAQYGVAGILLFIWYTELRSIKMYNEITSRHQEKVISNQKVMIELLKYHNDTHKDSKV